MKKITSVLALIGFSFISHSQNINLNNSTDYIRVQKNGETGFSRAFGLNGSNELYIGSVEETISNMYFFNKGIGYLMTIKPDGNVGIGTTVPSAKLHIDMPISSGAYFLKLANKMKFRSDGVLEWGVTSNQGILSWDTGRAVIGALANQDLSIYANASEKIRVKTNGDVGIGTNNPTSKLHVAGNGAVIKLQNTNYEDTEDAFYGWLGGYDKSGDEIWWVGEGSSSTSRQIGFYTNRNGYDLTLWNNNEGITIKSDGNVGIGTTSPDAKLAVNGNIHTKEVKVDLIGWSDFVFENNYNLPTLKEVEQHIKDKGHLKDIPSSEEVKKNGIFLGDMDSKLLQKIEELTLYTIDQEKRIEVLESKNEDLKKENLELQALSNRLAEIEKLLNNRKQ